MSETTIATGNPIIMSSVDVTISINVRRIVKSVITVIVVSPLIRTPRAARTKLATGSRYPPRIITKDHRRPADDQNGRMRGKKHIGESLDLTDSLDTRLNRLAAEQG